MKYECWLCGEKVETTDLFATINFHIENGADEEDGGDIVKTLKSEKICSWCATRPYWWKRELEEFFKKHHRESQKKKVPKINTKVRKR